MLKRILLVAADHGVGSFGHWLHDSSNQPKH